jgi:adenylate cyclase
VPFILDIISRAQAAPDTEHLLRGVCEVLNHNDIPVWRASLVLEFLHPEISGALTVWTDGHIVGREADRVGLMQSSDYINSPARIVYETQRPLIRTLDGFCADMPFLEGLRQQGATAYAMFPFPFLDRSRAANISFATRARPGFTDLHLDLLRLVSEVVSPYAERQVLRRIARDLLDTYVGPRTGQRILSGEIERGHVESIEAAIWFADLRGFTQMSETLPVDQVLAVLDQWFDLMHATISAHGGEILKFVGDGALAIFPVLQPGKAQDACGRAFAAAAALVETLGSRQMVASRPWSFGIGLHVGQVAYGNIGASRRLDFTVIGPAVNMAARLEQLSKRLGYHVVASDAFQSASGATMIDGGAHELAGLGDRRHVFVALPRAPPG